MEKENCVEKEAVLLVIESRNWTGERKKARPKPRDCGEEEGGERQLNCGVREIVVLAKWASPERVMLVEGERGVERESGRERVRERMMKRERMGKR